MKSERIIAEDPVAKAREMIARGFPADKQTTLNVYSGTIAQAKQIRKLLDDADVENVSLIFGTHTVIESSLKPKVKPRKPLENVSPEAVAMIKGLWAATMKGARQSVPKKEYEPASYGHVMIFYHDGEHTVWAANAQVTEFTTDFQLAYVGSRFRLEAMYDHVNRRVAGIKKHRHYKINGEKVKVDDYFVWDDMYASRPILFDDRGVMYESNKAFQAAMAERNT